MKIDWDINVCWNYSEVMNIEKFNLYSMIWYKIEIVRYIIILWMQLILFSSIIGVVIYAPAVALAAVTGYSLRLWTRFYQNYFYEGCVLILK